MTPLRYESSDGRRREEVFLHRFWYDRIKNVAAGETSNAACL